MTHQSESVRWIVMTGRGTLGVGFGIEIEIGARHDCDDPLLKFKRATILLQYQ